MPDNTKVSVLVPLYNHGPYIVDCLDSLLTQEPADLEVLLLDDGSKDDGFLRACGWEREHGGRFQRISFKSQINAGITKTMDRLIREACGLYIVILASDDVLLPGSIAARLKCFEDESIGAVFGDAIPIDEDGKVLGRSAISELGRGSDRKALGNPKWILWELIFRFNVYGSILMARRSVLIKPDGSSILNTDLYSEDMQLYYAFAGKGILKFLDSPVAYYRIHAASTCRSPENEWKIRLNIFQSRSFSLQTMPRSKKLVILLQMMTFYRKGHGLVSFLLSPFVLGSYALLLFLEIIYDFARRHILKGQGAPSNS